MENIPSKENENFQIHPIENLIKIKLQTLDNIFYLEINKDSTVEELKVKISEVSLNLLK